MRKKVQIKITEDGKFYAETIGIKGKECLSVIEVLEELLDAETIDSEYTEEYYQTENHTYQQEKQQLKEEEI